MRRLFLSLAAAAIALGVPALSVNPASADALTMGCNVQPSANGNFSSLCTTSISADSYKVDYFVQGQTGTYTYAWTPPAGFTIVVGCTSATAYCTIKVPSEDTDQRLQATVVATQGSVQTSLSATARLLGTGGSCGKQFC
jgi:hypothetical protein